MLAIAARPWTTEFVGLGTTGETENFSRTRLMPGGSTVIGWISRLFASFVSDTALPVSTWTTAS